MKKQKMFYFLDFFVGEFETFKVLFFFFLLL